VFRLTPTRVAAAICLFAATAAHALERVTLRNGFSYDCARRQPLDATHVRLFLTADAVNYVDLAADSIASVELLPDPPVAPPPAAAPLAAAVTTDSIPDLLARAGALHNLDVDLLASIVKVESGGRSRAVSRAGARGLMQLMPGTARDLGVQDAFQPGQNIAGGTAYLDALLLRYDSAGDRRGLDMAIAAYNAGPAAVDRYHGIPPYRETRAYVARVETEFLRRKKALTSATPPAAPHSLLASR
jgi:soluble lytic murein transglycosylase-like protein